MQELLVSSHIELDKSLKEVQKGEIKNDIIKYFKRISRI